MEELRPFGKLSQAFVLRHCGDDKPYTSDILEVVADNEGLFMYGEECGDYDPLEEVVLEHARKHRESFLNALRKIADEPESKALVEDIKVIFSTNKQS